MKKVLLVSIAVVCAFITHAQYTIKLSIKNGDEKSPLAGATVLISSLHRTAFADTLGMATFTNIAAGSYSVSISYAGMEEQKISVTVPQLTGAPVEVWLAEADGEDEVIITATRTSRSIKDLPTRVETISGEELAEKANMKPGDIRMMLNESTGIQAQQTSATSYNSSIRIQGLDGRYTQILRDGFPLYAGFSGGLSLMQVTPLDLRQVEVIKGSSSTLYGGGAIAGLVNLVSKTPTDKRELSFVSNLTSAKGLDLSGFYSQRFRHTGLTVFGSRNTSSAYDPAHIGLTAIPQFERYTINPRLFVYGNKTNANAGFSYITEDRTGGSMEHIRHGTAGGYYESNQTERFTTQLDVQHRIGDRSNLQFRNSYSRFNRLITIPAYVFEGVQRSSYSELTFNTKREKTFWIAGTNFLTDDFNERKHVLPVSRSYHYNTYGIFAQNTWTPAGIFSLETGLRGDYTRQYGLALLPRISVMLKPTPRLTVRLGGGLGYKTPTVFNEDAEKIQFQNILPINQQAVINERSTGGNLDVNYRTYIGEVSFNVNQLFFYTQLNKPLVLTTTTGGGHEFINANGHIDTKGIETNLRFIYSDFKLFIGYTYADVNNHFNNIKSWLPLTARHRLNNVLMYEQEGKLKIGAEAYFFSPQRLSDGATGKPYWIFGLMGEKSWNHFSLFINFENFTDTRQTRFDSIYTGTIDQPTFRDIYAPVDGFVTNGGVKIRL